MMKKQGALVYDHNTGRYNIRFGLNDYYGGLHCGQCMDIMMHGKWTPTSIEYGDGWYLVGIKTNILDGLMVRI